MSYSSLATIFAIAIQCIGPVFQQFIILITIKRYIIQSILVFNDMYALYLHSFFKVNLKIDAFFPVQYKRARKIKSKRVKRVVNRLMNKESEDDERNTVKKRKIVKQSTKIKTTQKQRLDNTSNVNELTFDERSSAMINVQKSCQKNASSDSTSDTSDEDHNYIPFNEKRGGVSSRSRGARGVRKTGNRQNTKKSF